MEKLLYAILLVKDDQEKLTRLTFGAEGISGLQTDAVCAGDIVAVVGDVTRAGFSPDKADAINYARVIEYLFPHFPLLPMRFGSILDSSEAVREMLERNCGALRQNLEEVRHKAEFGLKVICEPEILLDELRRKAEVGTEMTGTPAGSAVQSVYREYVEKKLRDHRLDELASTHAENVIAEITGYILRLNAKFKFKKMAMTALMVDAVFLIDRRNQDELVNTISELQNHFSGLKFVLTGPWPPFSFVDITIK
jgi:hypothetical protein